MHICKIWVISLMGGQKVLGEYRNNYRRCDTATFPLPVCRFPLGAALEGRFRVLEQKCDNVTVNYVQESHP